MRFRLAPMARAAGIHICFSDTTAMWMSRIYSNVLLEGFASASGQTPYILIQRGGETLGRRTSSLSMGKNKSNFVSGFISDRSERVLRC